MEGTGDDSEDKMEVLPSTETDAPAGESGPPMSEEQWDAIEKMLRFLLEYRDENEHDPSKVFHKRVNKRNIPGYYDVIKNPMAFSNLKASLHNREYKTFKDFVHDSALIWHNAHTYNRPDAQAYEDASIIKDLMEKQLKALVEKGTITADAAEWPDLGEIPPVEDMPEEEDEDEEEEADAEGEDDEDDEADDSDEDAPRTRRKGRPSTSRQSIKADAKEPEAKKRRGRPPKVDTPMEARMKNVLKGIRKPKNDDGSIMIHAFEKLPDKALMADYYNEIKNPIAIEQIKKAQKRKRYKSMDQFMKDVDTMFENAKLYNKDDSEIYRNAVMLQAEAHRLAEIEKKKTDDEFVMEEGRKPRPDGITHNGVLWKVGDWVHLRNRNDEGKPIVAQIYRTWEDSSGGEFVNACWYYRPEQTVHHYEKHFFPNEVVKTGQYRDHPISDVLEKCFVMFFTRFSRGRPRGIGENTEVYVCEARYNEEKHKMNKIKTWASCLPDEVRDQDYEMDLFPNMHKVKKVPSPLLYLHEGGEPKNSEPPKPQWGPDDSGPPISGGVYGGPRDENQSPPPERTPTPPPQPPPPPPPKQTPQPSSLDDPFRRSQDLLQQAGRPFGHPPEQTTMPQQPVSYMPQPRHYSQAQTPTNQSQQAPMHSPHSYNQQNQSYQGLSGTYSDYNRSQTSQYPIQQRPYPPIPQSHPQAQGPWVLPDRIDRQIPESIRQNQQLDEQGRVLFFDHPPVYEVPRTDPELVHSLRYKALKIKRDKLIREREDARAREAKDSQDATNSGDIQANTGEKRKSNEPEYINGGANSDGAVESDGSTKKVRLTT